MIATEDQVMDTATATGFDPMLSVFPSTFKPDLVADFLLSKIIDRIRSSEFANITQGIGATYKAAGGGAAGKIAIDSAKKKLPAVTLAGEFNRRTNADWRFPSGLVQIDIDGLGATELANAHSVLVACPWIACLWASPSGCGLKGAVRVDGIGLPDLARYKTAWQAITRWLASIDLINDPAAKDAARLAYLCHDADAYLNADAEAFDLDLWAEPVVQPALKVSVETHTSSMASDADVERRALAYVSKITSIDRQNGSGALMQVLRYLHDGFALERKSLMSVVLDWNATNAHGPWDVCDIDKKLEDVEREPSTKRRGWLLNEQEPALTLRSFTSDSVSEVAPPTPPKKLALRTHADRLKDAQNPIEMIVDGLLPAGGIGALIAMPGVGKTLLALDLAAAVAGNGDFAGRKVKHGRVIYAATDSQRSTEGRMVAMPSDAAERVLSIGEMNLPADMAMLDQAIVEAGDVALVIIDTWDSTRAHDDGGWASQDAGLEILMRGLRTLADKHHLATLVLHHATRGDNGRARGSVVFDARADWIAAVLPEGTSGLSLTSTKCRDGERGTVGRWQIEAVNVHDRLVPVAHYIGQIAPAEVTAADRGLAILQALATSGEHSVRSVAKRTVLPQTAVQRCLDELRESGLVERGACRLTPAGRGAVYDAETVVLE